MYHIWITQRLYTPPDRRKRHKMEKEGEWTRGSKKGTKAQMMEILVHTKTSNQERAKLLDNNRGGGVVVCHVRLGNIGV